MHGFDDYSAHRMGLFEDKHFLEDSGIEKVRMKLVSMVTRKCVEEIGGVIKRCCMTH